MKACLMDEDEVRDLFFETYPSFKKENVTRHNQYNADTRTEFAYFIDALHRDGYISDEVVNSITLDQ